MKVNNRILVVDDDLEIHRDFFKILSPVRLRQIEPELERIESKLFDEPIPPPTAKVEYQIETASRADDALERICKAREENQPFALVFTDVRIPPGIDGVQLVRKILHHAPDTQIVVVSAFYDYTWEEMTSLFGWSDNLLILRKPVDPITVKQVAMMLTRKWTSERELREHRQHLEAMVEARTASLTHANQRLKDEIEERMRAEAALTAAHHRLEEANRELEHALAERKQTEAQLRALLGELEAANKELENFAYIVSHDLKAPLRAISSISAWLQEDFAEALGERGAEYMADLQDQVRWMHNLVEGILEYSRLGRAKFELKTIESHQITERVVEVLNPPPGIRVELPERLPLVIYDRTHLEQLMQNLIGNAIKHMGRSEGCIRITCEDDRNFHHFRISDDGPGIDPRHFERIFKIFQTLKPREASADSTGIGLSLVKRIVERHGGTVWVESTPGSGATFHFTISKALRSKGLLQGSSVVVIDDNADFCAVAETMLKRAGFRPMHACSGHEALQLLSSFDGELDLALLDLNLPGENVLQLYPELKALRPEMRFLVCTGEPQSRNAVMMRHLGVDGLLIKPFNLEDLNQALERAFS